MNIYSEQKLHFPGLNVLLNWWGMACPICPCANCLWLGVFGDLGGTCNVEWMGKSLGSKNLFVVLFPGLDMGDRPSTHIKRY